MADQIPMGALAGDYERCAHMLNDAEKRIAELEDENAKLRAELLTPQVYSRLVEWLNSDPIKPAVNAFTAGIERQIAYALEMDVVPLIKRARSAEKQTS